MARRLSNVENWQLEAASNRISGHIVTQKFGSNPDIDTGAEEDIFSFGGTFYYPTTATQIQVVSDSANDTGGSPLGTGAWEVTVTGLDANYNVQEETFTLNGTTAVVGGTSPLNTWIRVYRVTCGACGTGGVNAGNIKVLDASSPGNVMGYVAAGRGQSEQCQFTIRAGYTGHILHGRASVRETVGGALKETSAVVKVYIRDYNESSTNNYNSWRTVETIDLNNRGSTQSEFSDLNNIPEKADIRVGAVVGANDTQVDARIHFVEVKNSL